MRKTDKDYRSYIVATEKPNDCLQGINRLGGRIYSKTVSLTQETQNKKGFWLSDSGLKKYLKFKDYPCHAHSVQAIIDDYCGARHSFFGNLKSNPNARPPFKRKWYHTFTWRASGITYKRGKLRLSMGRGRDALYIKIDKKFQGKVPAAVSLVYNRNTHIYEFHATYETHPQRKPKADRGSVVAVDLGEIHPIVSFDGLTSEIYNGRYLRSLVQYREKFKATLNQLLSRCQRGSRRWKKLKRAKNRTLHTLNNLIRDVRHKITSRFVSTCKSKKVETIVIGDIKHIRHSIDYGSKINQKLHQWAFGQITEMIAYKAKAVGIEVDSQDEAYTSQTCPQCGHRKKPNKRAYHCRKCKWQGHRDVVGASNILTKYQGWLFNPVVGA
ncbi:transposase, partial [Candidatus Poribacteria bacterium]|nr:transposase [Candidatus Poribacteria bacterium]